MDVFTTFRTGRNAHTKKVTAFDMMNIRPRKDDQMLNNWNCFDMKIYNIQIRVDRKYFEMSVNADTPALLVDEIRKLAKEYFDDVINSKPEQ